ncbi:choline-binding protein A [Bacillus sp. DX1.1]|nr:MULTISPECIES: choline-binding protein A [unclassified Bacillus (in: firmicutes)]MDM5155593.1 choline-binding protein A [Bacillus sp. DX1.1]MDM5186167.1 choline-binding protein A [Bacillus sp. DX4.1]WJE79901.1 choline-binding protein A [Bacillus sp. DX3.1]
MQKDWQSINNAWYYFDSSGIMLVGWQSIKGTWYYFTPTAGSEQGQMVTGWKLINDKWYEFQQLCTI